MYKKQQQRKKKLKSSWYEVNDKTENEKFKLLRTTRKVTVVYIYLE